MQSAGYDACRTNDKLLTLTVAPRLHTDVKNRVYHSAKIYHSSGPYLD